MGIAILEFVEFYSSLDQIEAKNHVILLQTASKASQLERK